MQQDDTARKRFIRKARSAAALDHPYLCHINEVGESEGQGFIAMEYVEGQSLKDRIAAGATGRPEFTQTSGRAQDISQARAYLVDCRHKESPMPQPSSRSKAGAMDVSEGPFLSSAGGTFFLRPIVRYASSSRSSRRRTWKISR